MRPESKYGFRRMEVDIGNGVLFGAASASLDWGVAALMREIRKLWMRKENGLRYRGIAPIAEAL